LTSVVVALADKIFTICGFFYIDEKPTGSKDPFALRRAALGLIRIILENGIRIRLGGPIRWSHFLVWSTLASQKIDDISDKAKALHSALSRTEEFKFTRSELDKLELSADEDRLIDKAYAFAPSVLEFIADRLKVALKEKGTRHDLIDAVFSLGNEDDLVRLVARVEALQSFLKTEEGANLLAGYKRAANILKAEEKKDKTTFEGAPDASALVLPEEKALFAELEKAAVQVKAEIAAERFAEAMGVMAALRAPVDAFFDKVTVNDKDSALRKNRLLLLASLRATLHLAADFSKIEG
jgi:glycyl-tRNA synthetase beta chain